MWSFWSKEYQCPFFKFTLSIFFYKIQHLVSLAAPFCVNQCQCDWVGSYFLHQSQLLMSVHFEKKNRLKGPTLLYIWKVGRIWAHNWFYSSLSLTKCCKKQPWKTEIVCSSNWILAASSHWMGTALTHVTSRYIHLSSHTCLCTLHTIICVHEKRSQQINTPE